MSWKDARDSTDVEASGPAVYDVHDRENKSCKQASIQCQPTHGCGLEVFWNLARNWKAVEAPLKVLPAEVHAIPPSMLLHPLLLALLGRIEACLKVAAEPRLAGPGWKPSFQRRSLHGEVVEEAGLPRRIRISTRVTGRVSLLWEKSRFCAPTVSSARGVL